MTWMWPDYVHVQSFNTSVSTHASKYKLYLYKERDGRDTTNEPRGIPVLFIPGNAGSFKQVRSIGSVAHFRYWQLKAELAWAASKRETAPLDFFSIDTNEELSAFSSGLLVSEAQCVNDAIEHILSLYKIPKSHHPIPTSVILVAHSMGGIVARTLFTLPNYRLGSVNTIITLASPHVAPPAPLDPRLASLYSRINDFWKFHTVNSTSDQAAASTGPSTRYLADVSLVSIAGGNHDTMISSDSAEVASFLSPGHGFTVYTTGVPNVWTPADHRAILWCNQMVKSLSRALYDVADPALPGKTVDIGERMWRFRLNFQSGMKSLDLESWKDGKINVPLQPEKWVEIPGKSLKISHKETVPGGKLHVLTVPSSHEADTFMLLSSNQVGSNELDVFACSRILPPETGTPDNCYSLRSRMISMPGTGPHANLYYLNIWLSELGDRDVIVIYQRMMWSEPAFLFAEFAFEKDTVVTVDAPNAESKSADGRFLSPLLHQSIPPLSEEKFLRNWTGDFLNFYGDPRFLSAVPLAESAYHGLELRVFSDRACDALQIRVRLDLHGSLGRLVGPYMTAWLAYSLAVVMPILGAQIRKWNEEGVYDPFGQVLSETFCKNLPKTVVGLLLVGGLQSFVLSMNLPSSLSTHLGGLLLGNRGFSLIPLLPVFYILASGMVGAIYVAMTVVLAAMAEAAHRVAKLLPRSEETLQR
ncbi:GPI inositol deacylase [Borealophlyctis nickersoniae]|nr:GPI inositol deacylase [Borealophlyctis nickersoniae]